jgi:hypothetical protein
LTVAILGYPPAILGAGAALGPFYPLAISYLNFRFGKKSAGALAYALGVGSFTVVFMHMIIGVVADGWGLTNAMLIGPLGLLVTLVLFAVESKISGGEGK